MADVFDQASDREIADRDAAISATLASIRSNKLQPVGRCHNCDEPLAPPMLFCDGDCSADHELRMRAKRY